MRNLSSQTLSAVAMLLAILIAVTAVVVVRVLVPDDPPPPLTAPTQPTLPDLAMPELTDLLAGRSKRDRQQLLFTAAIANIGRGPFLIAAVRGDTRGAWRVSQRFRERDGTLSERATPGALVFGGHGHEHWHVELGATYEIRSIPGGKTLRAYTKVGYCFFDQVALSPRTPGASTIPRIPKDTCSGRDRVLLEMGLSPGWSDPYQWTLPDQRLDVTGLEDGVYRLWATADPDNWFREADERNNETWVDFRLRTSVDPPTVAVVRVGPHVPSS